MTPCSLLRRALCAAPLVLTLGAAHAAGERITVLMHNLAEPTYAFMNAELLDEARKLKVEVRVVDAQGSSPKQTADVATALTQGTDGLIVAPTDAKALVPALNEVIDEKIPLLTFDRRVDGAKKDVPHVGADNVAGGRMMAEWVVKTFPKGARIVFLTGQPGSSTAIDRATGVHQVFAKAGPAYKIIAEQTANWQRDLGLTVTQNILTSLGNDLPQVILSSDDDMALGALEAIRTAGLEKAGIRVLGFNASPEALREVQQGGMDLTVDQSPSQQIRTALREMVKRLREKTPLASVAIQPLVITKDNLSAASRPIGR